MVYFGCLNLDVQIWCQNQVTLDLPFYYGLSWRPLDLILTLTLWLNLLMRHQICLITTDMSSHLECSQGLATTTDLQCTILFGCCGTSPVLARLLCILCFSWFPSQSSPLLHPWTQHLISSCWNVYTVKDFKGSLSRITQKIWNRTVRNTGLLCLSFMFKPGFQSSSHEFITRSLFPEGKSNLS